MNLQPSPISNNQWQKVVRALAYSAGSGFVGGFILGFAGVLQGGTANFHVIAALETAAIVGGAVGALNSLAVTVKQLFTTE